MLHAVNEWYGLTVFWLFVAAFIAALAMIFIFPFASLLLVFLGVFALLGAVLVAKLLGAAERGAARSALHRSACPRCGAPVVARNPAGTAACARCGEAFLASGALATDDHTATGGEDSRADQPFT